MFQSIVLDGDILILMEEVVDLELKFRGRDIPSAEFILQFYQFVLKFDSQLPFIIEIVFELVLGFFELLPFVLEHELDFCEIVIIWLVWVMGGLLR